MTFFLLMGDFTEICNKKKIEPNNGELRTVICKNMFFGHCFAIYLILKSLSEELKVKSQKDI